MGWIRFPPDLFGTGTKPGFLADFADLRVRPNNDGSCEVVTLEEYQKTTRPSVRVILLARGTSFEDAGLNALATVPPLSEATPADQLDALRELRRQWLATRIDKEPEWSRFSGELQLAREEEVVELLRGFQAAGNPDDSLWLVTADQVLSRRLAVMRALFAARHAKEAWKGGSTFEGFPAARALMTNTTSGFILYLLPALYYRTPWHVGTATFRAQATIVRVLAEPEPGRDTGWGSPLDAMARYAGQMQAPTFPPSVWAASESQADREELLRWWAERVGALTAFLGDFSYFRDNTDSYSPSVHLGTVLTVERLFVTAVEMMRIRKQNEWLRKLLLFDVLDLLEGHGAGRFEQNLDLSRQRKEWTAAMNQLPGGVLRCLRPLIDGALAALEDLASSLWASSRRSGNLVQIEKKSGQGTEGIGIDRSRAEYLRILRDAHHGYRKILSNPRDLSYLASFTGEVSERLPDLVWWYLLRLLLNPAETLLPSLRT